MKNLYTVKALSGARYRLYLTVVDAAGNETVVRQYTHTPQGKFILNLRVGDTIAEIPTSVDDWD